MFIYIFSIFDLNNLVIMNNIKSYINQHKNRFINELIEILKIPSISADSAFRKDVVNMASKIKTSLEEAGCDHVEICETPGYPIVYGEKLIDPKLPTILVYGHYDVQPPDPINLWNSPPFEPVIKRQRFTPKVRFLQEDPVTIKGKCICI